MLYTIGHSNRTFPEFVRILKNHKIDMIADVRGGRAGSRAFPHFNCENLADSLPQFGIKYIHIPDLGGRRSKHPLADDDTNGEWRLAAFKSYADYAYHEPKFDKAIDQLLQLGQDQNVAYMCSEAVPWRCHRTIITDYMLLTRDVDVTHIVGLNQTIQGNPNQHSSVEGNKVCYRKQQMSLPM